jgi:hypothetical protein
VISRSSDIRGALRARRQRGFLLNPFRFGGGLFYPSQLFQAGDQGFFYDFGVAATMRNASGVTAAAGEFVRSTVRTAGDRTAFACTANGPIARAGYLELFGNTGNAVLQSTVALNFAGGYTTAALFTEPATFPDSGAVLLCGQSTTSSGSACFRGPHLSSTSSQCITFATFNNFTSASRPYTRVAGDKAFHLDTVDATNIEIWLNGTSLGTSSSGGDLHNTTGTPVTVGASYAGAGTLTFYEYTGRIRSLFAIDRVLAGSEIAAFSTWAAAQTGW